MTHLHQRALRTVTVLLTALLALALLNAPSASASAASQTAQRATAPAATASWSFSAGRVHPGDPVAVRWRATGFPAGTRVDLVRMVQNTPNGRNTLVAHLAQSASGTRYIQAPKAKGTYHYRIYVFKGGVRYRSISHDLVVIGAPPAASLALTTPRVNQGALATVRFTNARIPTGSVSYLQRTAGSSTHWINVARVTIAAGTHTIKVKAPIMGTYNYRIVTTKRGFALATSHAARLYVYNWISGTTFRGANSDTVEIGASLFRYIDYGSRYGDTVWRYDSVTCSKIEISAAVRAYPENDETARVELIQETADPAYLPIRQGQIKKATFPLSGRGVALRVQANVDGVFLNYRLLCYTPSGQ